MKSPTLVVSNPPHDEVDLETAASLLELDVFSLRLKTNFAAPEVIAALGPDKAVELAVALRKSGLRVTILPGPDLGGIPWPDPATYLAFDDSCLRATASGKNVEIAYDREVVCVYCEPPSDFSVERTVDLGQAMASGHVPTIVEAIQWSSIVDVYWLSGGSLRRLSILPHLYSMAGEDVLTELGRRFKGLRLDRRLAGVRPRARYVRREADEALELSQRPTRRRGYSFGTPMLSDVLASISENLRYASQYELGSRMAYALDPLTASG